MRLEELDAVLLDGEEVERIVASGVTALELMRQANQEAGEARTTRALTFLAAALRLDDRAELWFNAGKHLADQGHVEDAVQCYDQAILRSPQWSTAYKNKASALARLGDVKGALHEAELALKLDPEDRGAQAGRDYLQNLLDRNSAGES
jgi:tetratricopeptide (TPR) repeat protein